MSITHGGRAKGKHFHWHFDEPSRKVRIEKENGKEHSYSLQEIQAILKSIYQEFRTDYFPLANNVARLSNGTEKMGLGRAILDLDGSSVYHAQGSSYLGVILEECGYLIWNGQHEGIEWRLIDTEFDLEKIVSRLKAGTGK